ncbi:MAG: PP2C family protein-serine/threonine phosphatase, partial [Bacteroidia bacterium]
QRTIILSTVGTIIFIMVLVIVIYSRYALKKKANLELSKAYKNIEIKNKQITDSINYSKRIQMAILPPIDLIKKHLKESFVYYRPKDIVSGDFYWFTEKDNFLFIIVGDCTGHGVPGALMSMVGNTLLHEIIDQKNILDPGDILTHLNKGVINALRQGTSDNFSQDDGMDISICRIDKNNNEQLVYASANHSIFIKESNKIVELSGDIFSIGGEFGKLEKKFKSNIHNLKKGDQVFMSTDGYYDQFGGEKNSKYLISRYESLLLNSKFTSENAESIFEKEHVNWKGNNKQTDDLLIIGFVI